MTTYYPEPWQFETTDAIEITVGVPPKRVAWTVDDDVYVHTGDTSQRDDGYVWIGELEWVDTPDDPCDDAGFNEERLRQFVLAWLNK